MKKSAVACLCLAILASGVSAQEGFEGRPITRNLVMPTGYTLSSGEFVIGIGPITYGLSDDIQIGTNLLLFLLQIDNVNLKVNLNRNDEKAFAVGFDYTSFSLSVFSAEAGFDAFSPFIAFTRRIDEETSLHFGGQVSLITGDVAIEDADADENVVGTSFSVGLEHDLSYKTKFLLEGSYDLTFQSIRIGGGVLFGWEKFRLKLGLNRFMPGDDEGGTLPVISLWWRFKG